MSEAPMKMDPVDGNAIAGMLVEIFGAEMTDSLGTCATCGTCGRLAELRVYMNAPGPVARCRFCDHVVMVLAQLGNTMRVDLRGLAALEIVKRT